MAWPTATPSACARPQFWLRETARPSDQLSLTDSLQLSVSLTPRVTAWLRLSAVNQPRFVPVESALPVLSAQPRLSAVPQFSLLVVEVKPPRLWAVEEETPLLTA